MERTPDAVAVVFEEQELTYRELNERANQLAHHLAWLGVGPEALVGLCLERSLEMVVGLLGILKAGGAYVPLDADYPAQRLAFMLADAEDRVSLSRSSAARTAFPQPAAKSSAWIPTQRSCRDLCPVESIGQRRREPSSPTSCTPPVPPGSPKGWRFDIASIARLVFGNDYTTFGPDRVFLQLATVSFDASTFELWGALLHGAKLVMAPAGLPDFRQLEDLLERIG